VIWSVRLIKEVGLIKEVAFGLAGLLKKGTLEGALY
jgi:hypothetical protein